MTIACDSKQLSWNSKFPMGLEVLISHPTFQCMRWCLKQFVSCVSRRKNVCSETEAAMTTLQGCYCWVFFIMFNFPFNNICTSPTSQYLFFQEVYEFSERSRCWNSLLWNIADFMSHVWTDLYSKNKRKRFHCYHLPVLVVEGFFS